MCHEFKNRLKKRKACENPKTSSYPIYLMATFDTFIFLIQIAIGLNKTI